MFVLVFLFDDWFPPGGTVVDGVTFPFPIAGTVFAVLDARFVFAVMDARFVFAVMVVDVSVVELAIKRNWRVS